MAQEKVFGAAIFLVLAGIGTCVKAAPRATVSEQFWRFVRAETEGRALSSKAMAASVEREYRLQLASYQSADALRLLKTSDVRLLFRAADDVTFYTTDDAFVPDMRADVTELTRRHAVSDDDYDRLYAAFVQSRMFNDAKTLRTDHPKAGFGNIPRFIDASPRANPGEVERPTKLVLSSDGSTLTRESLDLSKPQVIIVSSPLCHFCLRAVPQIERDAELRRVVAESATWLVPPDGHMGFERIAEWNRAHPNEQMVLTYRERDWPKFDDWDTPTFYFYRDGRVVDEFTGWPLEGNMVNLRNGLRKIGLVPSLRHGAALSH